MKRNTMLCLVMALLLVSPRLALAAGWQAIGDVNGAKSLANGVELKAGSSLVRVTALGPGVIRVHYSKEGKFPQEHSFAVVANTGLAAPTVQVQDSAGRMEFATGEIMVRIDKSPLRISFLNPAGQVISQDDPEYPVSWNGSSFRVWKSMPADEHYFGLGDKAGPIDHRGQSFAMWNTDAYGWVGGSDPLYKSIPFFLGLRSGAAFGIFLDNTFRSTFDFGKESRDLYSFGSDGGELDYYFIYGPSPKKVIEQYTALTGRTPLPPLFSLGFQQSRYSYYPESRVREVAGELRKRHIPADVLYLDIDYEDGYRPFTIDRKRFPTFEQMVKDLDQQGFKLVTIVDLHLKQEPGYKPYDEGLAGDHFVKNPDGSVYVGRVWPGDSVFPDFTRTASREWFGTLHKDFVAMGVRGFWNDMNEPAVFRTDKTMPLNVVHRIDDGGLQRQTDHREAHNLVGMQNVRATHEGLLQLKPNERPFVLTRAAFAGTQRFAATWTGDNLGTWEHLRLMVPTLLSLGISGYGLAGADIGGFGSSAPPDLVTRWMEVGAFTPFYRNHTDKKSRDKEPWVFGPEKESIMRRYIEARYRLLPYIYTAAEEMSRSGVPIMRPIFMEFPNSDAAASSQEYMFGADLLVAPKLNETLDSYDVNLPTGVWYDYWTHTKVEKRRFSVSPPLDTMPVYVRGGAIIPHQPLVQSTSETPQGPLELLVYPGPNCSGSVYFDDGNSFNYKRGEYVRERFTCNVEPGALQIHLDAPEGTYRPWWSTLQLAAISARKPSKVTIGGHEIATWTFDPDKQTVAVNVPASTAATDVVIWYAQ